LAKRAQAESDQRTVSESQKPNAKLMNEQILQVNGREHVVKRVTRSGTDSEGVPYPEPNYQGTGMALCGVLLPGQNLKQWMDAKRKRREALGI
jgi:hypothetical protein